MAEKNKPVDPVDPVDPIDPVELVYMCRDVDIYGAPNKAAVHPDEVDSWLRFGWVLES